MNCGNELKLSWKRLIQGIYCKYIEIMSARAQAIIRAKDGNAMFSFFLFILLKFFFNCYLFRMTII
jgi:hypothetical protein